MKTRRGREPKALIVRALITIALALQTSGCLYLKNGKTEDVRFESKPTGAQVVVNGVPHGSTPTTVTLSRCTEYKVVIKKPGYDPADVLLSRAMYGPDSLTGVGDTILILPIFVDIWNCSDVSLHPNPVNVQLLPIAANTVAPVAKK